jgi:hypothetical protein
MGDYTGDTGINATLGLRKTLNVAQWFVKPCHATKSSKKLDN